ncbi:EGF-like repeat and discoidin I-like domain-containing protein 3 [Amphiura filiformis]|uniref:EGF-like repeat and discoidin I-like domain-containing protein 3 n=1 Tax=Amphiura filiformis TaxID=82378 RepID=UPI003B2250A9
MFIIFYLNLDIACRYQLGVEDGRIGDEQITASSFYASHLNLHHAPQKARLNAQRTNSSIGAWCAAFDDANQWIQVDLNNAVVVNGVMIQGRGDGNYWVTKFRLQYGVTVNDLVYVQTNHTNQESMVFDGNTDQDTIVTRVFPSPVRATVIRIHPSDWQNFICMRFDLIGCEDCRYQIGVEDGRIGDEQITASSFFASQRNLLHAPPNARLNAQITPSSIGAWCAEFNDANQWIQVNLSAAVVVNGVMIQGRHGVDQWVTKFRVQYGVNEDDLVYVQTNHTNQESMVFDGNTDEDTIVTRVFPSPVRATIIRIRPSDWHDQYICMRFDLMYCA